MYGTEAHQSCLLFPVESTQLPKLRAVSVLGASLFQCIAAVYLDFCPLTLMSIDTAVRVLQLVAAI